MRKVSDVMSTEVRTVSTTDAVGPVRDLLLGTGIHAVPVADETGEVVGIVTSWDLVEEWGPDQPVATVMSEHVSTVVPAALLVDAARAMRDGGIHHLVVVDEGGGVVGMVSSLDLLGELAHDVERAVVPPSAQVVARTGDIVVIRGHAIGMRERRGLITEVRGDHGGPPFLVQWLDDPHSEPHEVLFFPGPDADIEHPVRA